MPPTLTPTLTPTLINQEIRYKILGFYIDIELVNFANNELSDNDKNILLYSFEKITEINRDYLSMKDKNLRTRKLFLTKFYLQFYTLKETIIISIPLIDDYKIYDENPLDLYNSLVLIIKSSMNSSLFLDIIKQYNSSSFNNININLVSIGDAEIRTVINQNITNSDNTDNISDYKLGLILVFGILGIIIITLCFYYKIYPKMYKCKSSLKNKKQKNKIYFIGEKESENSSEMQKDISEESRIVEIANKENNL